MEISFALGLSFGPVFSSLLLNITSNYCYLMLIFCVIYAIIIFVAKFMVTEDKIYNNLKCEEINNENNEVNNNITYCKVFSHINVIINALSLMFSYGLLALLQSCLAPILVK